MDRGLASADSDSRHDDLPDTEAFKNLRSVEASFRPVEQFAVVAEGAPEVTALREDHRAGLSRIVGKREGQESADRNQVPASVKLFRIPNSASFPSFHWSTGRR